MSKAVGRHQTVAPDNTSDWITSRITLVSDRGARLVLHQVSADTSRDNPGKAPVLLAHGTFSNHRTCGGLARYLAGLGHDCWLIDYEGHGGSDSKLPSADFESLFLSGTRAVLQHIGSVTTERVHWVGHSGGGLAALMALARNPDVTRQLRSLVLIGSQAHHAGTRRSHRCVLRLFSLLTRLLGFVPGKRLGLGPENEAADVMLQWYRWNLRAQWQGTDGFDYVDALRRQVAMAPLKVLGIAGSGDHFIAPPSACRRLFRLVSSDDSDWLECGTEHGFSEDFTHGRLISSRAAAREIWPRIGHWLSAVESSGSR